MKQRFYVKLGIIFAFIEYTLTVGSDAMRTLPGSTSLRLSKTMKIILALLLIITSNLTFAEDDFTIDGFSKDYYAKISQEETTDCSFI